MVNYHRKMVIALSVLVGGIVLLGCDTGEVGNGAEYPDTSPGTEETGQASSTSATVPQPLMMTWDPSTALDQALATCPENSPNPDYPDLVSEERQRCVRAKVLELCPNFKTEDDPGWIEGYRCEAVPAP